MSAVDCLLNAAPTQTSGTPKRRVAVALGPFCLLLAGCAGPTGLLFGQANTEPLFAEKTLSVQAASDAVVPGRSTKAEVLAALGKATVVKFESGYEVWVYRGSVAGSQPTGITEFVILFGPDGVLKKSRVRAPSGS